MYISTTIVQLPFPSSLFQTVYSDNLICIVDHVRIRPSLERRKEGRKGRDNASKQTDSGGNGKMNAVNDIHAQIVALHHEYYNRILFSEKDSFIIGFLMREL